MDEIKYWLWLNMVFGTKNHRIREIIKFFCSAQKAYLVLSEDSTMVSLSENENKNVHNVPLHNADVFLENCEKRGRSVICHKSFEYPSQLKHIYNTSSVIYYKGNIKLLRDGAIPMYDASDVMNCINGRREPFQAAYAAGSMFSADTPDEGNELITEALYELNGIPVSQEKNQDGAVKIELPDEVLGCQRPIAETRENDDLHADELTQILEFAPSELMSELTELVIFSVVCSISGKMFELIR